MAENDSTEPPERVGLEGVRGDLEFTDAGDLDGVKGGAIDAFLDFTSTSTPTLKSETTTSTTHK